MKATKITKSDATKPSKAVVRKTLPDYLHGIAVHIGSALVESTSLSETLGELTRDAGIAMREQPDLLDSFMVECKEFCAGAGLTEGSFKVYMSNIRGVIRAMIDGYEPQDGQSLRAMYDAAPKGKGANKGNTVKGGARHNTKAADVETDDDADEVSAPVKATAAPSKADARRDAMVLLFGHCDDELDAAVQWAAAHEPRFINLVKQQIAFDNAPAKVRKAA